MNKITEAFVKEGIKKRSLNTHKGDYGKVLVVAGINDMPGAAYFASLAALRTGSGLVYVCTCRNNFAAIQTLLPEAICIDYERLSANKSGSDAGALDINSYDAVAFGPGMGTSEAAKHLLREILDRAKIPLIIDADGLNMISIMNFSEQVKKCSSQIIITPHIGEARRLLGGEIDDYSRNIIAMKLQKKYGCTVVLKGNKTLICSGQEWDDTYTNTTGNPGMATAGAGDVLTGIIASLAGQGIDPIYATRMAVFIHGLAGDLAAADKGEHGMIARDILEKIPFAIRSIVE